jgi:predicted DNA binding CopG/RHH family protein
MKDKRVAKIKVADCDDSEKWEDGTYGQTEEFVQVVPVETSRAVDDTLGLTQITLRLQKTLVEQLKVIAADNGLGYQPFVRQILTNYVKENHRAAAAR